MDYTVLQWFTYVYLILEIFGIFAKNQLNVCPVSNLLPGKVLHYSHYS
jgi:hypothetical protein